MDFLVLHCKITVYSLTNHILKTKVNLMVTLLTTQSPELCQSFYTFCSLYLHLITFHQNNVK